MTKQPTTENQLPLILIWSKAGSLMWEGRAANAEAAYHGLVEAMGYDIARFGVGVGSIEDYDITAHAGGRVVGFEALSLVEHFGEGNEYRLAKFSDPTEDARDGLTLDEAQEIATEDDSLIYAYRV